MNHKLHNTILASTVVGAALLFGSLAAQQVGRGGHAVVGHSAVAANRPAGSVMAGELRTDLARDMERRARRLEQELAAGGSTSQALTTASMLLATSVMETTLATVLEDIARRPPPAQHPSTAHGEAQRERAARSRSAMAMPYFSSARTPRRGSAE